MITFHRRLVALSRIVADRREVQAAVAARHRRPVVRQDPREHGDRAQRHARPVGLDERPEHPLVHLGLGHRLAGRRVEALAQLRPPHVHQHHRQGQGRRLRDHAYRPAPAVEAVLPVPAAVQHPARGVLRVGRGDPRPRLPEDPHRREVDASRSGTSSRRSAARAAARSRRTTSPTPPSAAWCRQEGLQVGLLGELHRQHRPQPLVERDHLLRALPGPDLHVHRGRGRERVARRVVRAADDRRGQHRRRAVLPRAQRQPVLPGRAPPLPGHAELALPADRAAGEGDLRAVRAAVQHRPVPQAVGQRAALDPAAGLPRRRPAHEARARTSCPRKRRTAPSGPRRRCRRSREQAQGGAAHAAQLPVDDRSGRPARPSAVAAAPAPADADVGAELAAQGAARHRVHVLPVLDRARRCRQRRRRRTGTCARTTTRGSRRS